MSRKQIQTISEKGDPQVYIAKADRDTLVSMLVNVYKMYSSADDFESKFLEYLDKLHADNKIQSDVYKKIVPMITDLTTYADDTEELITKLKNMIEDL